MSTPPRRRVAVVALGVAVVLFGCTTSEVDYSAGSGDDPGVPDYPLTDQGIAQSIRDHMTTVGEDLNLWVPTDDEADCAARRLVERFGAARLLAIGYQPATGELALAYEEPERAAAANILDGCIDYARGLIEMMTSYSKVSLRSAECLARGIDDAGLTRPFAMSLVDGVEPDVLAFDSELGRGVSDLMVACMEIEDLDPILPLPKYPGAFSAESTTTTPTDGSSTSTTVRGGGGADGVVPAGGE